MAYDCTDVLAGSPDLYQVDTLGPGPLAGLATGPTTRGFTNYPGLEIPAYDPFLGAGKFVFAKASATIAATAVVEISVTTVAGRYDTTATAWAAGTCICRAAVTSRRTSIGANSLHMPKPGTC